MIRVNNNWDRLLTKEYNQDYYQKLRKFLISEYKTNIIYPNMNNIFNALVLTDYLDVKVVILGQDPYHNPNQAHGLSFSVLEPTPPPPSLQNIYKELKDEYPNFNIPNHGNLTMWAKNGVLLLNTILTVRKNSPMSHAQKGWEILTDKIIANLAKRKKPMVFMLWGSPARKKKLLINKYSSNNHLILETTHPSPLSAYRGFLGCGHFKKANDFLKNNNIKPINWQL